MRQARYGREMTAKTVYSRTRGGRHVQTVESTCSFDLPWGSCPLGLVKQVRQRNEHESEAVTCDVTT